MQANTYPKGLIIFGFGGHARSVADVATVMGIMNLRFIDSAARDNERYLDHPVEADWEQELPTGWAVFSASGNNGQRRAHLEEAQRRGWPVATLIAPSASLGASCRISPGCFIGQHAHIGPRAHIAEGCIINTGAIVEHESRVGEYSHVAVNATVAGRSAIGADNFIGAGATVIDGVSLTDRVQLGAGAVATRNLTAAGLYLGIPARLYRSNQS